MLFRSTSNGGWANYTIRQFINNAALSNVTGTLNYRITFNGGPAEGLKISAAYIGQGADSADPYDFAGTPTQILFGGSAGCTIAANGSIVCDPTAFTLASGKHLVISIFVTNDASYDSFKSKVTLTNWQYYYKAGGNDAATVNTTGYSAGNAAGSISLIETEPISSSAIKKAAGVAYASIKKIAGVAIASVKKVAGLQ